MDSSGLPSLLVEAAKTAAEEDGVATKEEAKAEVPEAKPDDEAEKQADKEEAPAPDEDDASVNAVAAEDTASKKRSHEESQEEENTPAPPLRRGKWTPEEEAYASRLIVEFKAGLLPLTDGTTLRTFLSKLLNCDPMRISKKFVGSNCIGKQVFRRRSADVSNLTPEQIQRTRRELSELEKRFLDRVTKGGDSKKDRAEKKIKLSEDHVAGGLGGLAPNTSAAAAGHALLGNSSGNAGLLAQLQASQPGMFNANDTKLFNSASAAGLNIPGVGASTLGNGSALDMNALMLQTGMTPAQISQLAQNKGYSSASLAAMIGQKRSFDRLMSLDFQSMQSIDNLANLIRGGMSNQASMGQMKNWDWNSGVTGAQAGTQNNAQGGIESMLGPQTGGAQGLGSQANDAFGMFGNYNQNSLLQNLQAQQQAQLSQITAGQNQRLGNLLQGADGGGNSFNSLLQNAQNGTGGLMGMPQQNLMGMGMNNSFAGFGGLSQAGNPMMAALAAQQQMLNQNMASGGFLSQQNQFGGFGGGMGGVDLSKVNLSDPNTSALVQQLLAQQQGGGGNAAGLASLGATSQQAPTPAQASATAGAPPAAPQAPGGDEAVV